MDDSTAEREVRAARNQSMFRAVNEQMRTLNEAFQAVSKEWAIACECADPTCVETISIAPDEYATIRGNPRQFAVLHGHVYPDVEDVVSETERYAVVEKIGRAASVAEALGTDD